jgi:hypothetical protein
VHCEDQGQAIAIVAIEFIGILPKPIAVEAAENCFQEPDRRSSFGLGGLPTVQLPKKVEKLVNCRTKCFVATAARPNPLIRRSSEFRIRAL